MTYGGSIGHVNLRVVGEKAKIRENSWKMSMTGEWPTCKPE